MNHKYVVMFVTYILQVMESKRTKRKDVEYFRDMHIVMEPNEEPTTPIYTHTTCKMGKYWDFSSHLLYQFFLHEDYSKFPFNEGFEEQEKDVYKKISQSYLHKVATRPTILPCLEIVGIMVQQEDLSNRWLLHAWEQALSSYQLEELYEKYHLLKVEFFMTT